MDSGKISGRGMTPGRAFAGSEKTVARQDGSSARAVSHRLVGRTFVSLVPSDLWTEERRSQARSFSRYLVDVVKQPLDVKGLIALQAELPLRAHDAAALSSPNLRRAAAGLRRLYRAVEFEDHRAIREAAILLMPALAAAVEDKGVAAGAIASDRAASVFLSLFEVR